MRYDTQGIVESVNGALANIGELVHHASEGRNAEEISQLEIEARETVLNMIAAIILADKKYSEGEAAFVRLLMDGGQSPDVTMEILNNRAEAWLESCLHVPGFFQAVVEHDERLHTDLAHSMIREIQLIGEDVCICDGHYDASEHVVVQHYAGFLEQFLTERKGQVSSGEVHTVIGWTVV